MELFFYHFHVSVNNCGCGGSCNNSEAPYASVCLSVKVKNMNVNVFNLKLWGRLMKHDFQINMNFAGVGPILVASYISVRVR